MSTGAGGRIPSLFLYSKRSICRRSDMSPIVLAPVAAGRAGMAAEDRRGDDVLVHYGHTDPCSHLRWTARECYQFMYERPWERISKFYADVICGRSSLRFLFSGNPVASAAAATENFGFGSSDGREDEDEDEDEDEADAVLVDFASGKERTGRWARLNFKIDLGYHGGSFDGWQKQPDLNTVQGVVEAALGEFVDERKAQRLKDKSLPVKGCAAVAGRTDKGVSALRQVCSFYTWSESARARDIKDAINRAVPGKLRALSVSEVSRTFHPNFSAKWRHYLYIFPLDGGRDHSNTNVEQSDSEEGDIEASAERTDEKKYSFSARKVNRLLLQLEGKSLSYKMFARDTKASRNSGPPTECYVFHARAAETRLPCGDREGQGLRVMCVELVANRFLRRMVRVLVATAVREAAAGAIDDALLKLMEASCRRATAPPAPPDGLCLADVGYEEFRKDRCLIS